MAVSSFFFTLHLFSFCGASELVKDAKQEKKKKDYTSKMNIFITPSIDIYYNFYAI